MKHTIKLKNISLQVLLITKIKILIIKMTFINKLMRDFGLILIFLKKDIFLKNNNKIKILICLKSKL